MTDHFDVIIVGAGLSGIGAAWHLQQHCPRKSYAILEGRDAIGGTWDLFRYPGIRSDSDMFTLGYRFRPWREAKAIADGPSIKKYVTDTAREGGIEPHIRFRHKVKAADWSSATGRWTVTADQDGKTVTLTCDFLFMASGYYNYDKGYRPTWDGEADFKGTTVHPQFWPDKLDYAGKRVVIIGSGATAVTLVPSMAEQAAHVTMLQRSPTYMVSRPARDPIADWLRARLPAKTAYAAVRWKNVLLGMWFFNLARKKPERVKERLISMVKDQMGPDYDVATHFTPSYNPWDQRLCLIPDNDMFDALKAGRASIVTDHIDRFVADGIQLKSGEVLKTDVVVTATGLDLTVAGGAAISVDGEAKALSQSFSYKGCMFSDIPNMAFWFGYTNASWTLKADLTSEYVCRLLNHMDAKGVRVATPKVTDPEVTEEPYLDFSSGYVQRALARLPKQGSKRPWKLYQNYILDLRLFRHSPIEDGALVFSNPTGVSAEPKPAEPALAA
jgi:cation diffusion facilitator CzcD-associated flavoprotein CzcO